MILKHYSFILVTESLKDKNLVDYFNFLFKCASYGISAIQIRNKDLAFTKEVLLLIKELDKKIKENNYNCTLFINDNYKVAKKLNINNTHIGQKDAPIEIVYQSLGDNSLIGYSTDTLEQVKKANNFSFLNYIGIGAIFPTSSKSDIVNTWGLDGLKDAKSYSKHPIVAIGGISEENTDIVLKNGADGVAIIGDIHNAKNPFEKIKNIKKILINNSKGENEC